MGYTDYNFKTTREKIDDLYSQVNEEIENLADGDLIKYLKILNLYKKNGNLLKDELDIKNKEIEENFNYLNQFLTYIKNLKSYIIVDNKEIKELYFKLEKNNQELEIFSKSFINEYENKSLLEKLIFGNTEKEKQKYYDNVKKYIELKKENEEINKEIERLSKKYKNIKE